MLVDVVAVLEWMQRLGMLKRVRMQSEGPYIDERVKWMVTDGLQRGR
jgi:hypothetical protein